MNCNRCGSPLTENDQFCKSCGAPANVMSAQNINTGNPVPNFVGAPTTNEVGNQFASPMNHEMNQGFGTSANNNGTNQMVEPAPAVMPNQFTTPTNNEMNPGFVTSTNNNGMNQMIEPAPIGMGNQFVGPINNEMNPGFVTPTNNNGMNQMGTPAYNNQTNSQPVKKSSKAPLFIILGVVGVIAVVAAVFFGIKLLGNDSNGDVNNNGIANVPENTSTYKVNYNGFTFKVPTDLVYQVENNSFILGDEDNTWVSSISVIEGSFNNLANNKSNIQQNYQKQGYTASSAVEKNINGLEFITIEVTVSGQNALLAYAKANSMYIFGIITYNLDNEFDYNLLETTAKVLKSAEYTGESNSIKTNIDIDMENIKELAK